MPLRTVGILSTGDMGAAIGSVLREGGLDVATSLAGRSELTTLRAAEAGIRDAGSVDALVEQSDLLLSVLVPSEAVAVAETIAGAFSRTGARPPVVECNAIAPQTSPSRPPGASMWISIAPATYSRRASAIRSSCDHSML